MCSRPAKSRTRYGCCPISLRLDVGRLLGGLYGLISGVTWLIGPFGYTGLRHLFAQRKRTGPAHEQQCKRSSYHSAVSTRGHPGGRTPLILVVEDDADIRIMIEQMLELR